MTDQERETAILDWARRVNRAADEVVDLDRMMMAKARKDLRRAAYRPEAYQALLESVNKLEDVTVSWYPPPTYIMSPRIKLYRKADISQLKFKGYLDKFEPEGGLNEEGEPVAILEFQMVPNRPTMVEAVLDGV